MKKCKKGKKVFFLNEERIKKRKEEDGKKFWEEKRRRIINESMKQLKNDEPNVSLLRMERT